MSVAELATIGAKIVEIGETLKAKRTERDEINIEISSLEKELMPLVIQHSKIIAEVIGQPLPTPPTAAPTGPTGWELPANRNQGRTSEPHGSPQTVNVAEAKKRILAYLDNAEAGVSAVEVAQELRMDAVVVRQVMADLARGR
jgi:hypothetical protein